MSLPERLFVQSVSTDDARRTGSSGQAQIKPAETQRGDLGGERLEFDPEDVFRAGQLVESFVQNTHGGGEKRAAAASGVDDAQTRHGFPVQIGQSVQCGGHNAFGDGARGIVDTVAFAERCERGSAETFEVVQVQYMSVQTGTRHVQSAS